MNTFLPYPDFQESAKVLDNKRLGKQRVECLQILQALEKGPYICKICKLPPIIKEMDYCPYCKLYSVLIKTPWYNHPAVQMWKNCERWLREYGIAFCQEWKKRGFRDTTELKIRNCVPNHILIDKPNWLGNEQFHLAMKSNLIRKKPKHYRPIFGNDIPDNLPYVWPKGLS